MAGEPARKITKRLVDGLRSGKGDVFHWDGGDGSLPGFGVKVTPTGRKVYVLQYRMGGRGFPTRRFTIGKHGSLTHEQARTRAEHLLSDVAKGVDPQTSKVTARENTIGSLVDAFIASRRAKGRRAVDEVERLLKREVVSEWQNRPIASITTPDVVRLVESIRDRGAPATANQTLTHLKTMFNWSRNRGDIKLSPADGVEKPAPEIRRERVHSDTELVEIWRAAERLDWPFGPAYKLLILTGQRREEVGQMAWSELDLANGIWMLPGERTKNGQPHDVHLSALAVAIIKTLPKIKKVDLIFSTTGETPISGWGRAKERIDAEIQAARIKAAKEMGEKAELARPMAPWRLHDLRRTFATGLNNLGVLPHVADRILNHVSKSKGGVMAVYNRAEYARERKAAMTLWAEHVERLLDGGVGKVLPMRRVESSG